MDNVKREATRENPLEPGSEIPAFPQVCACPGCELANTGQLRVIVSKMIHTQPPSHLCVSWCAQAPERLLTADALLDRTDFSGAPTPSSDRSNTSSYSVGSYVQQEPPHSPAGASASELGLEEQRREELRLIWGDYDVRDQCGLTGFG